MSHHLLPFGQTLFETRCCSESWLFFALWKKNPKPKQFQDWVSDALWSLWLNSEVGSGRIWEMMSSCAVLGPVLLFSWVTAVPDSVDKQTTVEKALNCLRLFWEVFSVWFFFFILRFWCCLCAAPDVIIRYHTAGTAQSQRCLKFLQLQPWVIKPVDAFMIKH